MAILPSVLKHKDLQQHLGLKRSLGYWLDSRLYSLIQKMLPSSSLEEEGPLIKLKFERVIVNYKITF